MTTNALLAPFKTPFEAPAFASITAPDFLPAFDAGMAEHLVEIDAIARNPEAPTFANTIDAYELSGQTLDRINSVFWNLAGTDSTEAMRAIEREMSPRLSQHGSTIYANAALFGRIEALFEARDTLALTGEQMQALTKIRTGFIKGGAKLDKAGKARAAAIKARLATLTTQFSQNVLKDETDWVLQLTEADLDGLPAFLISAAKAEAESRGLEGNAITLLRSSVEPFLTFSTRRDLREQAFTAWTLRGDQGATDNKPLIREILALRAEYARLLGYADFAAMKLSDTMAKSAIAAQRLLDEVWPAGKARAAAERDALMALAQTDYLPAIKPWDWRYYSEKQRQQQFDLDEATIKPYFQLSKMIQAAFDTATRLFGLTFRPRADVPVYHPDVQAFEVLDKAGAHMALFYGDYFARPGKRSGAWMSSFRDQKSLGGAQRPIIINVMNFGKPATGVPALLSFDDARTLFHEFGHALHGMLSNVTYPCLAGTNVPRDFVELPSQLYEHWLEQPAVLAEYGLHAQTGEPMPQALLDRLIAARTFNQGFMTVEYCASALMDMALHALPDPGTLDVAAFEAETLTRLGMPPEIVMRHRTPHFSHVFSGDGYAAGYYSYLWSEVLDADAFQAFRETGDIYDAPTAQRLAAYIYSAGHSRDPEQAYTLFRGRLPEVRALLAKRGLKAVA